MTTLGSWECSQMDHHSDGNQPRAMPFRNGEELSPSFDFARSQLTSQYYSPIPTPYFPFSQDFTTNGLYENHNPFDRLVYPAMSTNILASQPPSSMSGMQAPSARGVPRHPTSMRRCKPTPASFSDTELQNSSYEKKSEPTDESTDGFPDQEQFDMIVDGYVNGLSVKKQDKALIHSQRATNIRKVLNDTKQTSIESAQFRFWAKKMFKLLPEGGSTPEIKKRICHEGKPVAIQEKLYKILVKAHRQCQHGGRDKTSSQVRAIYSWVPKELISRFVKICPTCQARRNQKSDSSPRNDRTHLTKREIKYEAISPPEEYVTSGRNYNGSESVWTDQCGGEQQTQQYHDEAMLLGGRRMSNHNSRENGRIFTSYAMSAPATHITHLNPHYPSHYATNTSNNYGTTERAYSQSQNPGRLT